MILPGGVYVRSSDSFASGGHLDMPRRTGIDKAFVSASGIGTARAVTCWDFREVALKHGPFIALAPTRPNSAHRARESRP